MLCACAQQHWIVRICAKLLSKCDLLITRMRIEVYRRGGGMKTVQESAIKCDKVWNCVTI